MIPADAEAGQIFPVGIQKRFDNINFGETKMTKVLPLSILMIAATSAIAADKVAKRSPSNADTKTYENVEVQSVIAGETPGVHFRFNADGSSADFVTLDPTEFCAKDSANSAIPLLIQSMLNKKLRLKVVMKSNSGSDSCIQQVVLGSK